MEPVRLGEPMILGGYSGHSDLAKGQEVADAIRAHVEERLGHPASVYTVLDCKQQVVAGTNYKLKIQVGEAECAHVRVFQALPYTGLGPSLENFAGGKSLADPLD